MAKMLLSLFLVLVLLQVTQSSTTVPNPAGDSSCSLASADSPATSPITDSLTTSPISDSLPTSPITDSLTTSSITDSLTTSPITNSLLTSPSATSNSVTNPDSNPGFLTSLFTNLCPRIDGGFCSRILLGKYSFMNENPIGCSVLLALAINRWNMPLPSTSFSGADISDQQLLAGPYCCTWGRFLMGCTHHCLTAMVFYRELSRAVCLSRSKLLFLFVFFSHKYSPGQGVLTTVVVVVVVVLSRHFN